MFGNKTNKSTGFRAQLILIEVPKIKASMVISQKLSQVEMN